ncbi:MAG: DUF3368 domain-containing protein [Chitinophagales bacterium]
MKNGLVIADTGPIFSLAIINKLELLNHLFDEIKIPKAVWEEITLDKSTKFYQNIKMFFKPKVANIKGFNELAFVMDYGESESVILYKELNADFLLIDDKKARKIAENFDIKCIGTLGILSTAKNKGLIKELRPIFKTLLENDRYYSINLLNILLERHNELKIKHKA